MSERATLVHFSSLGGVDVDRHRIRSGIEQIAKDLPAFKLTEDAQRHSLLGVLAADDPKQQIRFSLYDVLARYAAIDKASQTGLLKAIRQEAERGKIGVVVVKDFPWAEGEIRTWCFDVRSDLIFVSVL